MNHHLLLFGLFFLITGQSSGPDLVQTKNISEGETSKIYQEIPTTLQKNVVDDLGASYFIDEEKKRLGKNGQIFWYDENKKIAGSEKMSRLDIEMECAEKCEAVAILTHNKNSPPLGYQHGIFIERSGYPLHPTPITDFILKQINTEGSADALYAYGTDIYSVIHLKSEGLEKANESWGVIYKNNQEIFRTKMFFGTEEVDGNIVLGSPAFNFYYQRNKKVHQNIFYKDETINEKYDLEGSKNLFSYKNAVGFVAEKNGKYYVMFNGQKISDNFDVIRTKGCCAIEAYPFQLDENGILYFMGKRGEKYYMVEVDLNKFL